MRHSATNEWSLMGLCCPEVVTAVGYVMASEDVRVLIPETCESYLPWKMSLRI